MKIWYISLLLSVRYLLLRDGPGYMRHGLGRDGPGHMRHGLVRDGWDTCHTNNLANHLIIKVFLIYFQKTRKIYFRATKIQHTSFFLSFFYYLSTPSEHNWRQRLLQVTILDPSVTSPSNVLPFSYPTSWESSFLIGFVQAWMCLV